MTEPTRPINVVNIATGICFVVLGVLLLMQRAGAIEVQQIVELWPLALVVLGGAVVWQASRGGDASVGAAACAGWLVWVALLGLLFSHVYDRRAEADAAAVDGRMSVFAVMSGDDRPAQPGAFTGATVTTLLGGAKIDLTAASLAPGDTAVIDLLTVLGGVDITVPRDWRVDVEATTVAAGVKDERSGVETPRVDQPPSPPAGVAGATGAIEAPAAGLPVPRLVIKGVVVFGGVKVK